MVTPPDYPRELSLLSENQRLRERDKMREDGERLLLGEIEARDAEIERLREALREIANGTIGHDSECVRIAHAALGKETTT